MRLNASDVLLDILVANTRPLSTHLLVRAGHLLGIESVAIRVALSRLVATGKVERTGRGSYVVARHGAGILRAVADWPSKRSLMCSWRGDWIAVQDSDVKRSDKVTWRRHRLALDLWGFRALRSTLSVRPANIRGGVESLSRLLGEVGVAPAAFTFKVDAFPTRIDAQARRLWDGEQMVRDDAELLARLLSSSGGLEARPLEDAVRESFIFGREVFAYLVKDPLLPKELMPADAHDALLAEAKGYQKRATRLWQQWLGQG